MDHDGGSHVATTSAPDGASRNRRRSPRPDLSEPQTKQVGCARFRTAAKAYLSGGGKSVSTVAVSPVFVVMMVVMRVIVVAAVVFSGDQGASEEGLDKVGR